MVVLLTNMNRTFLRVCLDLSKFSELLKIRYTTYCVLWGASGVLNCGICPENFVP